MKYSMPFIGFRFATVPTNSASSGTPKRRLVSVRSSGSRAKRSQIDAAGELKARALQRPPADMELLDGAAR